MGNRATHLCRGRVSNAPVVGSYGSETRWARPTLGDPIGERCAHESVLVGMGQSDAS